MASTKNVNTQTKPSVCVQPENQLYEISFDNDEPHGKVQEISGAVSDGPIVIGLPGNGLNFYEMWEKLCENTQRYANKLKKLLIAGGVDEKTLQKIPFYVATHAKPPFYDDKDARTIMYKKHGRSIMSEEVKNGNNGFSKEEENPAYIETLYNQIIAPRISRLKGKVKLDAKTAEQNVAQLVIFAHCHGAYVALKLEELMAQNMKKLGYTPDEIAQVQKQMTVVAYAPACPLGVSKMNFVSFGSLNDTITKENYNNISIHLSNLMFEDRKCWAEKQLKKENKSKPFDFKLSFYPDKLGHVFLIKQKSNYDDIFELDLQANDYYLKNGDIVADKEHNNIFEGETEDSKTMQKIMQRVFANALLHAIKQQKRLSDPLSIQDLVVGEVSQDPEADLRIFNEACQRGKAYYKKFYEEIVRLQQEQVKSQKR